MQLVLSNNRVLAHGENFISMGGTVINTETNKVYQNATVAECDGCPSDIDTVGYEYHAGEFVPCAPYGKGNGNIAVVCNNDCKAIKDSGIPLAEIGRIVRTSYTGSGGSTVSLTFDAKPVILFITGEYERSGEDVAKHHSFNIVTEGKLIGWIGVDGHTVTGNYSQGSTCEEVVVSGNTITIRKYSHSYSYPNPVNYEGDTYKVIAIVCKEENKNVVSES